MAENILHFGAVRLRLNGTGSLQMKLIGLDDANNSTLLSLTMATAPGREPSRLANFNSQRAKFKGFTTGLDEYFKINRIILFVKPLWTDFPT